jgi:hypothetical protein
VVVVESMDGFVAGEKISVEMVKPSKKLHRPGKIQDELFPGHFSIR